MRALREEATITADVRAVINRCDFGFLGKVARADHVARILGDEKRLFVRNARVAVECVNVGTPMALAYPSDKSVKDVAAIAAFCAGLNSAPPRRRQTPRSDKAHGIPQQQERGQDRADGHGQSVRKRHRRARTTSTPI